MFKHATCTLILFLAASSAAWAAPVIDVGTHYMLPDDVRTIPITVSGGDQVEALNFFIQVADGGEINEGTDTKPKITAIDIIGAGTLFSQSNRGSAPTHLPGSGGTYLIWSDWTITQPDVTLSATGTLAYVTIDTTGTSASDPAYALNLEDVAAGYDPPGYNTDFGDVSPTINAGWIVVTNLRDLTWNASANGAWTDTTWDGAVSGHPTSPNYTSNAIVNTAYTVNVTSAQEANSLALSGGGKVAISSAGSLTITGTATVSAGGTLSIVSGADLTAAGIQLNGGTIAGSGTINPTVTLNGGTLSTPLSSDNLVLSEALDGVGGLTKSGDGTATLSDNATYAGDTTISAGRLQINGLNSVLENITGDGTLGVGDGSTSSILTADSIQIDTLSVGAGSKVVLTSGSGGYGPTAGQVSLTPVPEPSTITLLIAAALGILLYCKKIR